MKRYLFTETHDGGEMLELPDGELTPIGDGEYSSFIPAGEATFWLETVLTANVYIRYADLPHQPAK